jgi:dTDP-4-dehydrorhamnose 3,5-epimerase
MQISRLALPGVLLIKPSIYEDERGTFLETWNARAFAEAGLPEHFVQDNLNISKRYVLRGLHYQIDHAQGKLIRVLSGSIFDAVVDLRRSSSDFGRALTLTLTAGEHRALWVPMGFAHGFLALAEGTQVQYKVTNVWVRSAERTLAWNDPELAIVWPLPAGVTPLLSAKDRAGSPLREADTYP